MSEKKARESITIRGKGCVVSQPRCPSVLPVGSPNFWFRKPRKKIATEKTKKTDIYHQKSHCSAAMAPPTLLPELSQDNWEGKSNLNSNSNLPHNKPTTAVKTIPKIPINGYKRRKVFRRAGNRKFNPANWWLEERKPTLKAVIRPSTIPPLWAF